MNTNRKSLVISIALIVSFISIHVVGQNSNESSGTVTLGLQEVSLIDANADVSLVLTPQSAGLAVKPSVKDSTARILISSVVSGVNTRDLSVAFTGSLPTGTFLKLQAKVPNASFVGTAGTMAGEIEFNNTISQNLVTGIGTCYSGTNADDGYKLVYEFGTSATAENYADIRAVGGAAITATYTLTAAQ
jgi:hypothetical protein